MKLMTNIYQNAQNHSYIEVINHGMFDAYFTVDYSHNNSNHSFKSKTLKSGMLDKIIVCEGSTNIHVTVYMVKATGQSLMLYDKMFNNDTDLKLLLSGTEISPVYEDITHLLSVNDSTELYRHYVSVTNTANYVAKLTVEYTINGKNFNVVEDNILKNHTKFVYLPTMAQNIKVLIETRVNKTAWVSAYNKTLLSPSILKLSLSGTFLEPIVTNISSELSTGNLPTLSENSISVLNNGDFISQFYITYSMIDTTHSITTINFSKEETKSVNIPAEATNIELAVNIMYTDNSWINIYQNFFNTSTSLKLELTGTLSAPKVKDITTIVPDVEEPIPSTPPVMKLMKEPSKPIVMLEEEIMFTLTVTNTSGSEAKDVILQDMLKDEAMFIANSLTVNGTATEYGFPSSGLDLGSINPGDSHKVTYKIKFSSIPNPNIVKQEPNITYSYIDNDNSTKQGALVGNTVPLMVVSQNHCCCCCSPCMCNCSNKNDSYMDYFNNI